MALLCIAAASVPFADELATTPQDRTEQRTRYLAARAALAAGQAERFAELAATLRDYPLYPYLWHADLAMRLSQAPEAEVLSFLERHADTPLAARLRRAWLTLLAERGDWPRYRAAAVPTEDAVFRCHGLRAQLDVEPLERLLPEIEALWLTGRSQPDACDPLFARYAASGRLTPARAWERVLLALQENNARLARYLSRWLADADVPWLVRALALHERTAEALDQARGWPAGPRARELVFGALLRLARDDAPAARAHWQAHASRFEFSPQQNDAILRALALGAARQRLPEALAWLDGLPATALDAEVWRMRLKTALRAQALAQIVAWMEQAGAPADEPAWRYWQARGLEAADRKELAQSIWRELAQERSYCGFLAADRLGLPYAYNDVPLSADAAAVHALAQRAPAARAQELLALGARSEAHAEWSLLLGGLPDTELPAAARLAQRWGWSTAAIVTAARGKLWDDLALRFPLDHRPALERAAARERVGLPTLYAIVRQESAFRTDARSPAGALGLMQLMPATARQVAARLRRPDAARQLTDPAQNIALGSAYLAEMLDRFGGRLVLAAAAYNAGPGRVARWLPDAALPADLWIDTLPFDETRAYVQNVLAYEAIYAHRLGRTARLAAHMKPLGATTLSQAR